MEQYDDMGVIPHPLNMILHGGMLIAIWYIALFKHSLYICDESLMKGSLPSHSAYPMHIR